MVAVRLKTICADLTEPRVLEQVEEQSVDLILTSPPYRPEDGLTEDLGVRLGRLAAHCLRPSGRMIVNFGQLSGDFQRPYRFRQQITESSELPVGQTLIWVKSIAVRQWRSELQALLDRTEQPTRAELERICRGPGVRLTRGHYRPISTVPKGPLLNYQWEFLWTWFAPPRPQWDRLSVGVSYADPSNLKRGQRGRWGQVHCAGDCFHIPYRTTGQRKKKLHRHCYPDALADYLIRLSGIRPGQTVLEPFMGSGTTAAVAKTHGLNVIGIDRDREALIGARSRWLRTDGRAPRATVVDWNG